MKNLFLVFLGGGLGSVLRYFLSSTVKPYSHFPLGTFFVNVTGSLILGLILGYLIKSHNTSQQLMIFLVTGLCGGYTTFSGFTAENFELLKSGHYAPALLYMLSSLLLGILAVAAGFWLSKYFSF